MRLIDALKAFWRVLIGKQQPACAKESGDFSHLSLLRILQERGRLVDFFQENIDDVADGDLGACVRKIHADCRKALQEYVQIEPILSNEEGSRFTVAPGFDAAAIKITGHVKGNPPYQSVVIHRGWKAVRLKLPEAMVNRSNPATIMAAEVEVAKS